MPRWFDAPRHAYTYAVLMSAAMSTIMTATMQLATYGVSAAAWHQFIHLWPLAFGLNVVAAVVLSPWLRRFTLWLWTRR